MNNSKLKIDKAIENYGKTDEVNDIVDKICAVGNPNPISTEDLARFITNHESKHEDEIDALIQGAILLSKSGNSMESSRK